MNHEQQAFTYLAAALVLGAAALRWDTPSLWITVVMLGLLGLAEATLAARA